VFIDGEKQESDTNSIKNVIVIFRIILVLVNTIRKNIRRKFFVLSFETGVHLGCPLGMAVVSPNPLEHLGYDSVIIVVDDPVLDTHLYEFDVFIVSLLLGSIKKQQQCNNTHTKSQ
jgi:hypothetical protein